MLVVYALLLLVWIVCFSNVGMLKLCEEMDALVYLLTLNSFKDDLGTTKDFKRNLTAPKSTWLDMTPCCLLLRRICDLFEYEDCDRITVLFVLARRGF